MACNKDIYICSFLLAVIAGPALLCTEGRQLKDMNKQKPDYSENEKRPGKQGKELTGSKPIPVGHKGDLQVTEAKEIFPPVSTVGSNPIPGFSTSLTAYVNGFQPTAPGNSPGVGHSHEGRKVESKRNTASTTPANVVPSLEANRDDFRPTGPGRSPGVGHAYQSTNGEQNV